MAAQGLIASVLEFGDVGRHCALGTRVHSRGEAIFFEVIACAGMTGSLKSGCLRM